MPTEKSVIKTSAVKTASALIRTGKGQLHGILLCCDGTNATTISVYDGINDSGSTFVVQAAVIPGAQTAFYMGFNPARRFETGCYVKVAVAGGGSCSYTVDYNG